MKTRAVPLAGAMVLAVSGWPAATDAATPPLGTPEGERLCAGLTHVLASGELLTTGGDPVSAAKAHGVFLGRLSVIAPGATYRLQDFMADFGKMTPAEQAQLAKACEAKLREIEGGDTIVSGPRSSDPQSTVPRSPNRP